MEGYGSPAMPQAASRDLRLAVPLIVLIFAILGFLLVTLSALAGASYDERYQLVTWPPSGDATEWFLRTNGPGLWLSSLAFTAAGFLLAAGPAGITGYFLARKAPPRVRHWGLFLLVGAWVLMPLIVIGYARFAFFPELSGWAPWFAVRLLPLADVVLAVGAIPALALAFYSSLRDDFLGLPWPTSSGSRVDRFVREALPRGLAGFAFGAFFTGTALLVDFVIPSLYGAGRYSLSSYMISQAGVLGGAPSAAVAGLILIATIVTFFVAFVLGVWAIRRYALPFLWKTFGEHGTRDDRLLSLLSTVVSIAGVLFTVYVLYLPIAASVVYSFNAVDSYVTLRGPPTLMWYGGSEERTGIFQIPAYVSSVVDSLWFAGLTTVVATPFGLLGAAVVPSLPSRQRFLIRVVVYAGAAIPLPFYLVSIAFINDFASFAVSDPLEPLRLGTLSLIVRLPLAAAVIFIVASASGGWGRRLLYGVRRAPWILPFLAGPLAAFAVLLGVATFDAYSQAASIYAFFTRGIISPRIDATSTILAVSALVPLAVAWVLLLRSREPFRF